MSLDATIRVLNATSGEGDVFELKDPGLKCKLIITGTAGAPIQAFTAQSGNDQQILKLRCSNWNNATVALHAKTDHASDDYSATGVVYSEDCLDIHFFR